MRSRSNNKYVADAVDVCPGTVNVWAEIGDISSAKIPITVKQPKATITNKPSNNTLYKGSTHTLDYVSDPSDATIIWDSGNEAIAEFDENTGKITAKAPGTVQISIFVKYGSYEHMTDSFTLTVKNTQVTINANGKDTLVVGEKTTLSAKVIADKAASQAVEWTSNNTAVATVNQNGVVTAMAPGKVTIYATSNQYNYAIGSVSFEVVYTQYGKFSCLVNDYYVYETRNENIAISDSEYDIWPADYSSRYYGYSYLQRAEALNTIKQTAYLTATAASILQPNAASFLSHFLDNTGEDFVFDVEELCSSSEYYNTRRKSIINEVLSASEKMIPTGKSKTIYNYKEIQVDKIYDCDDWQNSIGNSEVKIKANVTKNSSNEYQATIIFNVVDFYDWDKNETSMGNKPFSPKDMWELHHAGLAKHFLSKGASKIIITWREGERWDSGANISINSANESEAY